MASRELQRLGSAVKYGAVRRRMRTLLWFVMWAVVGFAVVYGPLDKGLGPMSIAGGVALGALMALGVHRSMVSRRTRRQWQVRFVWPARLVMTYLVLIVLLQLHATGALPAVRRNYGYQFERLAVAISAHYPALHELDPDWETLRATYGPRAAQASNEEEFLEIVAEMLSRFHDRQVYVVAHGTEAERSATRAGEPAAAQGAAGGRAVLRAEVLPSGIGYIALSSFGSGTDAAKQFDEALDGLGDVPGLIIDVRGSTGTSFDQAHRVAGRLVAEPFTYGTVEFRHRLPHFGWVRRLTYTVVPRGDVYLGPIVVLVDGNTRRAAEAFALALKTSGRATVIGTPTAGLFGLPLTFRLPGGAVHFPVGRFKPAVGGEVEGAGLLPDMAVAGEAGETVSDEDVVLVAAIDYLIQRI